MLAGHPNLPVEHKATLHLGGKNVPCRGWLHDADPERRCPKAGSRAWPPQPQWVRAAGHFSRSQATPGPPWPNPGSETPYSNSSTSSYRLVTHCAGIIFLGYEKALGGPAGAHPAQPPPWPCHSAPHHAPNKTWLSCTMCCASDENKALGAPVASVWQKVLAFNQQVTPALSHQCSELTKHRGFH